MRETDMNATFERFREHLPVGGHLTLMILKGHLLVEEQVIILIENRIAKFRSLKDADLTTHQKICLAEALIEEHCPNGEDAWLWPAIKKLNMLRNDIAHNLAKAGVEDRVVDFVRRVPKKMGSKNLCHNFEFALWVTCAEVHCLIEIPNPADA